MFIKSFLNKEMVKIRLRPKGKKGQRSYQLVAIDERKARDSGKYLAYLGYYDPYKKESNMAQFKEKIDG